MVDEKALFDGRLHYHDTLNKLMVNVDLASLNDNKAMWIRGIRRWFTRISPYIKVKDRDIIREKLRKLNNKIAMLYSGNKCNPNSTFGIDDDLFEVEENIMMVSKQMYLPIEEFETEFNEERFLKESE